MSAQEDIREALSALSGMASAAAAVAPAPWDSVIGLVGTVLGGAAAALDAGEDLDAYVARIHRIQRIDTRVLDAALDARIHDPARWGR